MKILLKRKLQSQPKQNSFKEGVEQPKAKLLLFKEFDTQSKLNPNAEAGLIREWYERYFEEYPPWDKYPYPLVKLKLVYELLKRDHENSGVPLPPKVKQNWEASRDFNIEGLATNMKQLVKAELTKAEEPKKEVTLTQEGGSEMVKKQATNGPKEKVYESYIRLFTENAKKKLSDSQLAAEMRKLHPDKKKYTEANIRTHRTVFNQGKFPTQKGKPKVQSVAYGNEKKTEKKVIVLKKK